MLWIYFNGQGVAECVVNTGNRIRQGDSFQIFVTQNDARWTLTGVLYLKPGADSFVTINDEYMETTETFELGNPSQANSYFQNSISYEGNLIDVPSEATSFEGNGGHVAFQFQFLNSATGAYLHAQTVSVYVEPTYGLKATKITGADYATLVAMMTSSLKNEAGGVAYLQNENSFTIGNDLSQFTFDTSLKTITIMSSATKTLTFSTDSVERADNGTITHLDWSNIETKSNASATYLAKQASGWSYSQSVNGLHIGRGSVDPNLGPVDEYMELGVALTDDTDATDIGITKLPTLSLSTDMLDNPNYSGEYYIDVDINPLGIKTIRGEEGNETIDYIPFKDIETKTHADVAYLKRFSGELAYLQNEYVFEIGGTSSSSVGLGRLTFDAYHEELMLETTNGVLLTFNGNGFERHYNDMITAVDWDDIETKTHAAATYMTISSASSSLLFTNAYQWAYSQVSDGFQISMVTTNPNGGTINDEMGLKMVSSTDTDVTDVNLTSLPALHLSTSLVDNPDYSDNYDIYANINALGIKFAQGVEGQYTPTYISFKDIETKSNASSTYLAKSANGVTYTQSSNGLRLNNNYGSLLLYLPSSSAGNSSIFISETGSSNRAYLQSDSIKYTTSAGASWTTVRYSDIAVKSNSLFIEPNSGTVYTQNIQGFTVSGINTASGVPTVRAVVYTVNEPRFFVGLRDQSTQADTYGVYVCPDEIFFRGQGESSYTHLKYAEIGKHVEIGPFTSVSDLASSLFEEDSHDYTVEDMHIYAVKSTTSSVTHMTMTNRRQCVYRIYTTKTPTTSKHVSLYIKVYDDDFQLVDYDNTTHGDLYAYIDL